MSIISTLGNKDWLQANEQRVKAMLPETWTHIQNLNGPQLGYRMKLLGIDWRSEDEFGKVMLYLERIGFMLRDGMTVRRNSHTVFVTDQVKP